MKRTNISLTEEQYEYLKDKAHKYSTSMSEVIRAWCERDMIPKGAVKNISETPKGHHLYTYPEPSPPKELFEPPKKKSKITLKEVGDAIEDVVTESMPLNPAPKPKKK